MDSLTWHEMDHKLGENSISENYSSREDPEVRLFC